MQMLVTQNPAGKFPNEWLGAVGRKCGPSPSFALRSPLQFPVPSSLPNTAEPKFPLYSAVRIALSVGIRERNSHNVPEAMSSVDPGEEISPTKDQSSWSNRQPEVEEYDSEGPAPSINDQTSRHSYPSSVDGNESESPARSTNGESSWDGRRQGHASDHGFEGLASSAGSRNYEEHSPENDRQERAAEPLGDASYRSGYIEVWDIDHNVADAADCLSLPLGPRC